MIIFKAMIIISDSNSATATLGMTLYYAFENNINAFLVKVSDHCLPMILNLAASKSFMVNCTRISFTT